jgi:hypothetical protein
MMKMKRTIEMAAILVLLSLLTAGKATSAFHHVIVGRGALEVQLIAAKLADRSGDTCAIITSSDENYIRNCRNLMYGRKNDPNNDDDDDDDYNAGAKGPIFVSDSQSIGNELDKADGLIIVCEDEAFDGVDMMMDNSPNIRHVAVLSKMGGGLRKMEESFQSKCLMNNVALSIVRAGILKGGGPGNVDVEGPDLGLSKFYYDSNYELGSAMVTMASDKFTLGARVTPGDPFKPPNMFAKIKSKNSFDPADTDTGRIAAAQSLLVAIQMEDGIDISLSTEKAEMPPTVEEWVDILTNI